MCLKSIINYFHHWLKMTVEKKWKWTKMLNMWRPLNWQNVSICILYVSLYVPRIMILMKKNLNRSQRSYFVRIVLNPVNYYLLLYVCHLIEDILLNLVNASVHQAQYDYSPNKLKITQSTFSRVLSFQNTNQYVLKISYIVSYHHLFYIISVIFVFKRFQNYMNVHSWKTNV